MEEGISQTVTQRVLDAMEEREAAKEKAAQEAQRPFLRATSVRALVEELHGFELRENENVLVCVPCSLYGKQTSGPRPTGFFSCQQPFHELRRATGIHYVIAKELLTTPKLYEDLGPLLFVFQHCTLKGNNEAVNEGLGGTISIHADGQRGLSVEKALAEARIHRNGPPLVHADAVLTGALNRYFEDKPWHFKHAEESRSLVAISGISLVLKRLKATQPLVSFFQ
jgi:hypothetical protein